MKITTIQISGFRKILKATINMEDDITVIAGANNSGKTSIVELFNYVFNAKGALCSDDFPVYESQEWCTAVFPYFQAQFKQENKKDDLIANILGTIVPSENPENEMLLTPIEVLIQVDYDPAGDDIRNFADYIMELSKPGVTKARDCLKGNTAYSILSAYKLFYVGCSRARRNLTILLDSSKIKGNLEPQKKRFEEIGFQVVSSPIH